MAQERQLREIVIKVDGGKSASDLKAIANSMGGFQKSLKETSSSMTSLRNIFSGFFAASIFGFGVREIAGFSDSMQQLRDRIKVLSGPTENADAVMKSLLNTANKTKTSIDGLATVYSRLAGATTETKISSSLLLRLTELLQNTFRVSGATIQEATAVAVQYSQALASGQVRGQELRSILEGNAVASRILRKEFGPDIFEKASKGMITAGDSLRALFKHENEVNDAAKDLGQTFEQSVNVALNEFKFALLSLNDSTGASQGFAIFIILVKDLITDFANALKYLGSFMPDLSGFFSFIGSAFNKFLEILVPGYSTLRDIVTGTESLTDKLKGVFIEFAKGAAFFSNTMADIFRSSQADSILSYFPKIRQSLLDVGGEFAATSQKLKSFIKETQNSKLKEFGPSKEEFLANKDKNKDLEDFLKRLAEMNKKVPSLKEEFIALNTAFLKGRISAEDYFVAIQKLESSKLEEKFVKGKLSLDKYREGLSELKKMDINRDFNSSAMSVQEFNDAVSQNAIEDLNNKLQTGKINLIEYNKELTKISDKVSPGGVLIAGTSGYLESVGTTASQVAKAIEGAFSGLETALTEFIQKGSQDWRKFAQGILDDLTRIIVRASIIQPIANALLGAVAPKADAAGGTTSYSANYLANAHGNVFDNGLRKFASGGVVSSPTLFGYGKSSTGLMGEAGPEAILPLSRGRNGDLGVQASITPVTVNIVNNTGANVEQRETVGPDGGRVLDVIISRKVNDGIASGSFDKALASSYGLRRRG